MSLADKLAARQIKDLIPYQSARRIGGIGNSYLNANESPYPAYETVSYTHLTLPTKA